LAHVQNGFERTRNRLGHVQNHFEKTQNGFESAKIGQKSALGGQKWPFLRAKAARPGKRRLFGRKEGVLAKRQLWSHIRQP
jgi:hypothetical protein